MPLCTLLTTTEWLSLHQVHHTRSPSAANPEHCSVFTLKAMSHERCFLASCYQMMLVLLEKKCVSSHAVNSVVTIYWHLPTTNTMGWGRWHRFAAIDLNMCVLADYLSRKLVYICSWLQIETLWAYYCCLHMWVGKGYTAICLPVCVSKWQLLNCFSYWFNS